VDLLTRLIVEVHWLKIFAQAGGIVSHVEPMALRRRSMSRFDVATRTNCSINVNVCIASSVSRCTRHERQLVEVKLRCSGERRKRQVKLITTGGDGAKH
jgi:hypothetical protein